MADKKGKISSKISALEMIFTSYNIFNDIKKKLLNIDLAPAVRPLYPFFASCQHSFSADDVRINTLHDTKRGEEGIYPIVLGTSSKRGDCGQVGRGERANGIFNDFNAERLPDEIVCYTGITIALPILAAYTLAAHPPRKLRRLYV